MLKTIDALAEQKVSGGVQGVSEKHVQHVYLAGLAQFGHQDLDMLLKDLDIAQPVLDKLRSDQLP